MQKCMSTKQDASIKRFVKQTNQVIAEDAHWSKEFQERDRVMARLQNEQNPHGNYYKSKKNGSSKILDKIRTLTQSKTSH